MTATFARYVRPSAIGGLLSLLFGITLIVGGLSARDAAAGGGQQPQDYCGGMNSVVGVSVPSTCPVGTLTITKVTIGDAAVPPEGFTVTIASENCIFPDTEDEQITLQIAPGASESTELYQYGGLLNSNETVPCQYTISEDAAPGWTAAYAPAAVVELPQQNFVVTNVDVTITNTAPTPTPTPTPSITDPTTSAPVSSVAPAPSTSAPALAATGTSSTTPKIVLGAGLCVLGVVLIAGTRPKRAHI